MPQTQPTIYDLLQPGAYQRLVGVFSQFDIKIDPRTLILNNQSKESVLSQVLSDLAASPKHIQLAQATQAHFNPKEIEALESEKKNIQDFKIFSFMRCMLFLTLSEEAAIAHHRTEKLKVLRHELHLLILKLASLEYERQILISENEKIRILNAERELKEILGSSFHDTYESCFHKLSDIHGKVQAYNTALVDVKAQKEAIKTRLREDSLVKAIELKNEFPELTNVETQVLMELHYKIRKALNKVETTLSRYDLKDAHLNELNAKIDTALEALEHREAELNKKERHLHHIYASPLIAGKHDKHFRMPESVKIELSQERAEINAQKNSLLDQKSKNNDNMQKRANKRDALNKDQAHIIDALIEEETDPALVKALNDDAFKKQFKEKFHQQLPHANAADSELVANRKEKYAIKIQKKHMIKEAHAIAAKQLEPVRKMEALNTSIPAQPAADVALDLQAQQIKQMMKNIHLAANEVGSEPKMKRKMEKLQKQRIS